MVLNFCDHKISRLVIFEEFVDFFCKLPQINHMYDDHIQNFGKNVLQTFPNMLNSQSFRATKFSAVWYCTTFFNLEYKY